MSQFYDVPDRDTAACGCVIGLDYDEAVGDGRPILTQAYLKRFCPLHEAAADLLATCQAGLKFLESDTTNAENRRVFRRMLTRTITLARTRS